MSESSRYFQDPFEEEDDFLQEEPYYHDAPEVEVYYTLATSAQRFANYFIDGFVMMGIIFPLVFLGGPLGVISILFIPYSYYFFTELVMGKTVGKMFTGTQVVHVSGRKPSPRNIFSRTFARFIPFDSFSFLTGRPGWHDELSETRVIMDGSIQYVDPASFY